MKRQITILAGAACLSLGARTGSAAVILNGTAPTTAANTYDAGTINVSAGTLDWVYYLASTTASTSASVTGPAPAQAAASFSVLTGDNVSGKETYLRHSSTGTGETIGYTSGSTFTGSTGYIFGSGNQVGDGVAVSYTMPALTTETLNFYLASFDALGEYTLLVNGQGTLAAQTSPVAFPANVGATGSPNGDGSGHSSGVYSFPLTNDAAAPATVTFDFTLGAANGTSASVGIQAASVTTSAVPEPATGGALLAVGVGALARRRRRPSLA